MLFTNYFFKKVRNRKINNNIYAINTLENHSLT